MMDQAASGVVKYVHFNFYTSEEIRKISVKKITKPDLLDAKNSPIPDGLYDPALGPLNDNDSCKSCGQLSVRCPGHCGHIDLAKPLYNPLLFKTLQGLLQITCFFCHKFKINEEKVKRYVAQLDLIVQGDINGARSLEANTWSEIFFPEEETAESITSNFDNANSKHLTWTSLQQSEALSIFSKFMRERRKKCDNCGKKNPTINSPIFGWLNKTTQESDIRANFILDSSLDQSSSEAKYSSITQSRGESASEMDEESPLSKKKVKLGDLPPEFIKQMSSSGQKHLLPSEVEFILNDLWKNEANLCMLISDIHCKNLSISRGNKGFAMFFLKTLLIPPSKFRPAAGTSGRGVLEHPQNTLLSKVQQANIALKNCIVANPDHPDILRSWMDLQKCVNVLFDSTKGFAKSDKEASGIRQLLEKKSGILRQKMMGKRVNFACRSVISPDPYLAVNEIGIPPYFALRLTYPERVTPWNVNKLRCAIINGADIHPGATHYKDKERMYKLQASQNMRSAISRKLPTSRGMTAQLGTGPESEFEGKVVYRHLQDGDIVLVNRQPTLHKPSMMAHVVRVLKGEKTLRMHYANCSTYNADFDGDEMNVHLPQDEISRAEAINIVNANKQYIVPTSGHPIRGLIQDHIVSAVLLTKMDTFLTREEYHQLLYASSVPPTSYSQRNRFGQKVSVSWSDYEIQPLPPAIWKPTPLWTGKQVITAILNFVTRGRLPLTIEKRGRIQKEYIGEDHTLLVLHIHNNELVHGMIDKAQFGTYGLVHAVHELYGPDVAGTLLSVFSRLFTSFLQIHGFTCGVDDLLLSQKSDIERERILKKSEIQSGEVHMRFTRTKDGDGDPMKLQREIEKVLRGNGDSATALLDRMMSNSLNSLTSEINQTLFPNGLLKPFLKNCLSLMTTTGAKGGLVNMTQISSLLGQQELEGKRVPRMVSGKTLPCFPPWDISSRAGGFISDRFLTGLRPQEYYFHCMAGRDGLVDTAIKTSRSGYLQRCIIKNLECLKVSYDHTVRDADGSVIQFIYGEDGIDVLKASHISEFKMLLDNQKVVLQKFSDQISDTSLAKSNAYIRELPCSLRDKATDFILENQKSFPHQINQKDFMKLMKLKYLSSLAEPGEAVGVVAAQSVGEPSTQMTLNTFHLAGKGDMNVTLGIPRLQEILMTASKDIRTPLMNCPLHVWKTKDDAERLAAKLRRVSLADVVERMEVCTVPFSIHGNQISTIYKLKMTLYPSELYPAFSELTLEDCKEVLETTFVEAMEDAIAKHLDMIFRISDIKVASGKEENDFELGVDEDESRNKSNTVEENVDGGDEDYESLDDQGTDSRRRKQQANDEVEYDDGIEKESFVAAGEHDEEMQSGFESEIDHVEADEDYLMGGGSPGFDMDIATPESPSKADSTPVSEDGKKKSKLTEKGKKETKSKADKKAKRPKSSKKKIRRTIYVMAEGLKFEVHYIFRSEPRILLAEIAQRTAKRVYVKEYKNIERCSLKENKKSTDPFMLQIAGVNFNTLWDLEEFLDIIHIYSNDIHAMLNTYGVEAARATIIKEVTDVFGLYGIQVNIRHLSLIADFMTFHGGYRSMNRVGMGDFNTSPFGKMTFETATKFIVESAFHGEVDTLESPSASVSLGQPVKMGTGCFDLMQNLQL
ncbi:DNA-directed RNA polymerase I subunit 1-like [Musa acuminata AAA Group]|uniref:DNA-directed RNA polymerase I subunit 1-like n=1 Tax=Musa acuminata AAA Group TaxID=214697 RepID=UPI0031DD179F